MNLQQLAYLLAIDTHRHFVKAAEACCVTQATLSMMLKKIEDELGILIFDRSKQPLMPTETGKLLIAQAKNVLQESEKMRQIAQEARQETSGELKIGVIPTLAPYLLPLFLPHFLKEYPLLNVKILEINTNTIIEKLEKDQLDVGLLATPLMLDGIQEIQLFKEKFEVFVSKQEKILPKKNYVLPQDIDINRLWLLEEGHCLRSQVLNLCELQKQQAKAHNLDYEAGSVESVLKIVEMNGGITVIPSLVSLYFDKNKKKQLRKFKEPAPFREISLVTYRHFVKKRALEALKNTILKYVEGKV